MACVLAAHDACWAIGRPTSLREFIAAPAGQQASLPRPGRRWRPAFAEFRPEGAELAREFGSLVNERGLARPLEHRAPSPLLPPTAALAAVLDSLQRNDYPETDAGARVRPWQGREPSVGWQEFRGALHTPPLDVLLDCDSWRALTPIEFPSQRHESRAIQVVEVMARRRGGAAPSQQSQSQQSQPNEERGAAGGGLRSYVFTFCLERVGEGPARGCWHVTGCRMGNYGA
eukprot:scaffold10.g2434.t1